MTTKRLLVEYRHVVVCGGRAYRAKAWAAPTPDATQRWRAWIEFRPVEGGKLLRSGTETVQVDARAAFYWATGLTSTYLERALDRTVAKRRHS